MPSLAAINDSSPCPAASRCRAVSPLVRPNCTSSISAAASLCRADFPLVLPPAHRHPPGPGCNYPAPGQHALKAVAAVAVAMVTVMTTTAAAAAATAAAAAATVAAAVSAAVTMTAAVMATVTAAAVAAASAVVTAVVAATARTVTVARTKLWDLPEASAYPGRAAPTVAVECSSTPEAVPSRTISSGVPEQRRNSMIYVHTSVDFATICQVVVSTI